MATIINASTSAGLVQTADTSGDLNIQSGGSTIVAVSSTGAAVTGTLSASGAFTPNQTTGIVGTTTNNDASVGYVAEYVSSTLAIGSATALTTNTAKNITSISLTAGDWDVSGWIGLDGAATTNITRIMGNANATTATIDNYIIGYNDISYTTAGSTLFSAGIGSLPLPSKRFSLSATTTIYLVGKVTFTISTASGFGYITARRVR